MRNFAEIYKQATTENVQPVLVEPTSDDVLKATQHQTWLAHPHTKEFLEKLEQDKERLLSLAQELACNGADEKSKDKALIRAENIQQILTYARSNR